jgi:hypothetical protein
VRDTCCTPVEARAWLEAITELALAGDRDAKRMIANASMHYVKALSDALP